jgi:pyruvate dehydrogenase (quinone)
VIECHVDPEVPPLPPHVTFKQARNFLSSIAHGDPHRWRMVAQSAKQVWAGIR